MQQEFWLQCWQQNHLGWQLDKPHAILHAAPADWCDHHKVFVPLCGKSPDLVYLAQSADVVGAELSEIACTDFFQEQQWQVKRQCQGAFTSFTGGKVLIWQGDFFALQPDQVQGCQRIYDRAALIALPPAMRLDYVLQLRRLLPQADMLLVSLEYPTGEKSGPPFSVTADEVRQLFAFADVRQLGQQDLTGQGFARRRFETSSLLETYWRIHWG